MEEKSSPEKEESTSLEKEGGWGGWGFRSLSILSDLQKAAAFAAEELSRNAAVVAKGIADVQIVSTETEVVESDEETKKSSSDRESDSDSDKLRKSALDKLEKASEDSLLGQGLKVLDNSMENLASGAWQAFGSAWKEGSNLVHKLETSAASLADSVQQSGLPVKAGSLAPTIIESGKAFTAKGMQVLEFVGKETMDLLISETGIEIEKNATAEEEVDEEQYLEEVTFDRCFYIYGGPEQLEELEGLSSHYVLLFNRRKAKLSSEQKSFYDGMLKQVRQIFDMDTQFEETGDDIDKGKNAETFVEVYGSEVRMLRDSSISKAAEMANGITTALGGLAASEMIQRTVDRLEAIHSEGVHRISELCCVALSQILILGKSVISSSSPSKNEEDAPDFEKIDWGKDPVSKAKIIRFKAQSLTVDVQAVTNSFVTGISEVIESYSVAIKDAASKESGDLTCQTSIQGKADTITSHLHASQVSATTKIHDGLQNLTYAVIASSIPIS